MKPKSKLTLKKITVSNLADDFAKKVYGGDETPTYSPACTLSCDPSPCTGSQDMPCQSDVPTACDNSQPINTCFTVLDCTYAECTDLQATCPETYGDEGCGTDTFPSV